jgi:hypothetical protein
MCRIFAPWRLGVFALNSLGLRLAALRLIAATVPICHNEAIRLRPPPSPRRWRTGDYGGQDGGSGGARTRHKTNEIKGFVGVPSQIASQKPVTLSHGLAQIVAAWDKLSAPLKAAILAIVNTATNEEGH